MIEAIRHGLSNLTNFAGRDSRSTFWYYMLFLIIVNIAIGLVVGVMYAAGSVGGAIEAASAGASEAEVQAQVLKGMSGSLVTQAWIGIIVSLITLALFVAAFVRRLRDAALPAAIAAIPVATSLFTAYHNFSVASSMQTVMATGDAVAINEAATAAAGWGMVGWIGYLVVIVCGAIPTRAA